MVTMQRLLRYIGAEPFRPFRIKMASGQSFEIRHPDMVHVGRSTAHVSLFMSDDLEESEQRDHILSLLTMESVEPLEESSAQDGKQKMTPETVLGYVKAQPFRPFRLHMAKRKNFDIRHPKMLKVGKTSLFVFSFAPGESEIAEDWESVSLTLIESISHFDFLVTS